MEGRWREEMAAIARGFKGWRLQHPRASLSEIAAALDARGAEERRLTTTHEQPLTLPRHRAVCRACGAGLSPLG